MKHIAPQFEIRWDEPEAFKLEDPKSVDIDLPKKEGDLVPHPCGDGPSSGSCQRMSNCNSPPAWGYLESVTPDLFD